MNEGYVDVEGGILELSIGQSWPYGPPPFFDEQVFLRSGITVMAFSEPAGPAVTCSLDYSSAVVGSIVVVILEMRVAGKPLSFACARIISSSGAM